MAGATVTGYDGDTMLVSVDRSACAACLEGRGCGMGLIAAARDRQHQLRLPAPSTRPPVGATIRLHPTHSILAAAAMAYGLPLVGLVAGASLGEWLMPTPGAVLAAVVAMLAMGWLARRIATRQYAGASACLARLGT